MVLNALVRSLPLNRAWARRPVCQCGKEVKPGMVRLFPLCSIMQELRGSWLTVNPYLPTLVSRDENLDLAVSTREERDVGGREKPDAHLAWYPAPWQHREAGGGLSWDLAK